MLHIEYRIKAYRYLDIFAKQIGVTVVLLCSSTLSIIRFETLGYVIKIWKIVLVLYFISILFHKF